eukprot:1150267-Pelagomonas_calceolata.AAC.2
MKWKEGRWNRNLECDCNNLKQSPSSLHYSAKSLPLTYFMLQNSPCSSLPIFTCTHSLPGAFSCICPNIMAQFWCPARNAKHLPLACNSFSNPPENGVWLVEPTKASWEGLRETLSLTCSEASALIVTSSICNTGQAWV